MLDSFTMGHDVKSDEPGSLDQFLKYLINQEYNILVRDWHSISLYIYIYVTSIFMRIQAILNMLNLCVVQISEFNQIPYGFDDLKLTDLKNNFKYKLLDMNLTRHDKFEL